jgi:cysteine desulfurase
LNDISVHIRILRNRFEERIRQLFPDAQVLSTDGELATNVVLVAWRGVPSERLLDELDRHEICAGSGSACSSRLSEVSHTLRAMGVPPKVARCTIRFAFGRFNTLSEVDATISALPSIIAKLSSS